MSNPNDVREIVKDNAQYYRESEAIRQNHEDYGHFLALNPQEKPVEKILDALVE